MCWFFYKTNICAARLCGNSEGEGAGATSLDSMQIRANKLKCINILGKGKGSGVCRGGRRSKGAG